MLSVTIFCSMTSVDNHLRPAKVLAFLFVGLLCLTGCAEKGPEVVRLQGSIYGTGCSVTYLHDKQTPPEADIKAALLDAFDVVNRSMNTYDPSSTISQFNASPVGEPFELDWDFAYVFNDGKTILPYIGIYRSVLSSTFASHYHTLSRLKYELCLGSQLKTG